MREIKFRGKRIDNNEWIYGSLVIEEGGHYRIIVKCRGYTVKPETVGQYIGLKDEYEKKVYDGDILASRGRGEFYNLRFIVNFGNSAHFPKDKEHQAYYLEAANEKTKMQIENGMRNDIYFWLYSSETECRVVGNIHDNPELIKGVE